MMSNRDLRDFIASTNLQSPESIAGTLKNITEDPTASIRSLIHLLNLHEVEGVDWSKLQKAKLDATVLLNYILKEGLADLNGVQELGTLWNILFDWNIDFRYKANFQNIFIHELKFWQRYHEMMFEQGLNAMVKILKEYSNGYIEQFRSIKIKLKGQGEEFFLTFYENVNLDNVFLTLIFIGKCCINTVRERQDKYDYFRSVTATMANLFREIKKLNRSIQIETAKIEAINEIVQSCREMNIRAHKKRELIEEFYKNAGMNEFIISIYRKRSNSHPKNVHELCWICIDNQNTTQAQHILKLKILMAQVHLKFVETLNDNGSSCCFLQKVEENLASTLCTINCFIQSQLNNRSCLKHQFISLLLELYLSHFINFPLIFQSLHKVVTEAIIFPLIAIDKQSQEMLLAQPLRFLNMLSDVYLDQKKQLPMTKASRILRHIVKSSKDFYHNLVRSIIEFIKDIQYKSDYFQLQIQQNPNFYTCWLILIAIAPQLREDNEYCDKILSMIYEGAQVLVNDISLCLITYLLRTMVTHHMANDSTRKIFNDFLRQGMARNGKYLKVFMVQLNIEIIQDYLSWQCFQFAFIQVFMSQKTIVVGQQKTDDNSENRIEVFYWTILQKGLKYHIGLFDQFQLKKIVSCAFHSYMAGLTQGKGRNQTVVSFTLRLISTILQVCSTQTIKIFQKQLLSLFNTFPKAKLFGFDDQIVQIIYLYLKKHEIFINEYNQLLKMVIISYEESSMLNLTCIQIFNQVLTLKHNEDSQNHPCQLIFQALRKRISNVQSEITENVIQMLLFDLLCLQLCIYNAGDKICQSKLDVLILDLTSLSIRINISIIKARAVNIILACRSYLRPELFSWQFILSECRNGQLSEYERRLILHNLMKITNNDNQKKDIHGNASILCILFEIIYFREKNVKYEEQKEDSYNYLKSKMTSISPFALADEDIKTQVQSIFQNIIKKNRLAYNLVKQELPLSVLTYFNRVQQSLEKQERSQMYVHLLQYSYF